MSAGRRGPRARLLPLPHPGTDAAAFADPPRARAPRPCWPARIASTRRTLHAPARGAGADAALTERAAVGAHAERSPAGRVRLAVDARSFWRAAAGARAQRARLVADDAGHVRVPARVADVEARIARLAGGAAETAGLQGAARLARAGVVAAAGTRGGAATGGCGLGGLRVDPGVDGADVEPRSGSARRRAREHDQQGGLQFDGS